MLIVGRNFKWKSAIEVYKNEVLKGELNNEK